MHIAVFDYKVVPTNPIGSCHLRMIQGLCREHKFTVFAVEFTNPCPERVDFVRVPAPRRPLALLFAAYHLVAPLSILFYRLRARASFDLIQMVESNLGFGDIAYVHFCHRAFLRASVGNTLGSGLRGLARWIDHWLHAIAEPRVFRRVRYIVVPSQGLRRELEEIYPCTKGKITVIPNPVDVQHFSRPSDTRIKALKKKLGVNADRIVMVFVALGHFERKGLHIVFEALHVMRDPRVELWVVGGQGDIVAEWRRRAEALGISGAVRYWGMQEDIRPFLWASDVFIMPSAYEAFPLVVLQAAAAGLPLIVTSVHGVEEFMADGVTGFLVTRDCRTVADAVVRIADLPSDDRRRLGYNACQAVQRYSVCHFQERWREFCERIVD